MHAEKTKSVVNVRLPVAQWDRICRLAETSNRSASAQLRVVVDRGLDSGVESDIALLSARRVKEVMGR